MRRRPIKRPAKFRAIDQARRQIALLEEANRQQRQLEALRRQDEQERLEIMMIRDGWLSD